MSEADDAFVQATDNLISLYRSVERRTLDLPLVSFMPFLLFFWATIKFSFFLYVGIFLILPVNLVISHPKHFPRTLALPAVFPILLTLCMALDMERRSTYGTICIC